MILEELKKGDKIYVALDYFTYQYNICEFQQILSENQCLILFEKEKYYREDNYDSRKTESKFIAIETSDIILDDEKIKDIGEYHDTLKRIIDAENMLSELKNKERELYSKFK